MYYSSASSLTEPGGLDATVHADSRRSTAAPSLHGFPAEAHELGLSVSLELVIGQHTAGAFLEVPDLEATDAADADAALQAAGFQSLITYEDVTDPAKVGKVTRMSPKSGTPLDKNHVVELFVGRKPGGATQPAPTPPDNGSPDGPQNIHRRPRGFPARDTAAKALSARGKRPLSAASGLLY